MIFVWCLCLNFIFNLVIKLFEFFVVFFIEFLWVECLLISEVVIVKCNLELIKSGIVLVRIFLVFGLNLSL